MVLPFFFLSFQSFDGTYIIIIFGKVILTVTVYKLRVDHGFDGMIISGTFFSDAISPLNAFNSSSLLWFCWIIHFSI